MARLSFRAALCALMLATFGAANAQAVTYTFYVGNTNASGCTVSTPAGSVSHVQWRLQATVATGASPQLQGVTRASCSGGVYGTPSAVSASAAFGSNTGTAGADVIEFQLPVGVVGPTPSPREVLAVVASNQAGSDGLIVASTQAKGTVLPPAATPTTIPATGTLAAFLLGAALLLLAWRALRRHRHYLFFSLLFVAGTAWAVAIVLDGQVQDWATVSGTADPAGDSGGGGAAVDLRAMYVTTQGPNGYIRLDIADLQNPPVADAAAASVLEDGSVTVTLTGSDPAGAPLTFQIATPPAQGTLGALVPLGPNSASVDYFPAADVFGSDSFSFTVDNGTQTSVPVSASITIVPVNDAPGFIAADPAGVLEGTGPHAIPNWASFDPGPDNESTQVAAEFIVSNISDPALFSSGPSIDASGTLSYALNPDANGQSGFEVRVRDDGGTADGGVDLSPVQTFTVVVGAVNGAPSFVGGGDIEVEEDAGAQSIAGWASQIDDGDPDIVQGLTFSVTGNTQPALFSSAPAVGVDGHLNFTPADDANGSARITLILSDDAGTASGGQDTSAPYEFEIVVVPANDPPQVVAPAPLQVHTHIAVTVADGATGDLLGANVTDPEGDAPFLLATPTATTSLGGGQLSIDAATGAYAYNPPSGFTGIDSFSYRVCDSGEPVACSDEVVVELEVAGPRIWFADAGEAPGGDGTLQRPFASLIDAAAQTIPGDIIFLASGTYAGTNLGDGVALVGQAVDGSSFDAALGISPPGYSLPRPAVDLLHARIEGGITLGLDNTLRGVELAGESGPALQGAGFGTLQVRDDVRIESAHAAMALSAGSFASGSSFVSVSSSGGLQNIALVDVAGDVDLGEGALSGSSERALRVVGGSVSIAFAGNISHVGDGGAIEISGVDGGDFDLSGALASTGGTGIRIDDNTGGSVRFRAPGASVVSSGATAISIDGNAGTAVSFEGGGLSVTGSNGAAIRGAGSGSLAIRGEGNVVAATGGPALSLDGIAIGTDQGGGESGLRLRSVSSEGSPQPGLLLHASGTQGGLTVTGSGAPGSGGTIRGATAAGVSLADTRGTALAHMIVRENADDGIRATTIDGLHLESVQVIGNGDGIDDDGIAISNASGTLVLSNVASTGNANDNFSLDNVAAAPLDSLLVEAGTYSGTSLAFGGNGMNIQMRGGSTLESAMLSGTTLRDNNVAGLRVLAAENSSVLAFTVVDASFGDTGQGNAQDIGADFSKAATGTLAYSIEGSDFTRHQSHAINTFAATGPGVAGSLRARIEGNTIGNADIDGSGSSIGNCVRVNVNGNSDAAVRIAGNVLRECPNGRGIEAIGRNGNGGLDITITGNDIDHVNPGYLPGTSDLPLAAIFVQSNCLTACNTVRADVVGNTVPNGVASDLGPGFISLVRSQASILQLVDSAPVSLGCGAQLSEANTGSVSASAGCTLIPGPLDSP